MAVEHGIPVEKVIFFIELLDICFPFINFITFNRVKFNKFKRHNISYKLMGAVSTMRNVFVKRNKLRHKIKNFTNLQINDSDKHKNGGQETHKVGQVLSEESPS